MIRFIVTGLGIFICYLLQSSVFRTFALASVVPDVLIVLVITAGYTKGKTYGLFTGMFAGLMIDFSIGDLIGLHGILYMLIGYLTGFSNKIYDKDDYTLPVLFIGIGEFLYQNMYYFVSFFIRGKLNYFYYLRRLILPKIIYTLAVGIILYKVFHVFHRILLRIERKED